jgi:hypothetical protein
MYFEDGGKGFPESAEHGEKVFPEASDLTFVESRANSW